MYYSATAISLLVVALVQGSAGSLPREVPSCQTALQTIQGLDYLNTFSSIVKQTRLAGLLNDPAFPATVFAVRNEALTSLSKLLSSNGTFATEQVQAIAHYHVLPFSLQKATRFDAKAKQFTTMLGQPIGLQQAAVPMVSGAQNSSVLLSSKSITACQAEVYIVDGVLLPDLAQIGNGSATRAAAQGLKMIRAAPSRRLLARADASQTTSHSAEHSHTGHTDASHHHHSQADPLVSGSLTGSAASGKGASLVAGSSSSSGSSSKNDPAALHQQTAGQKTSAASKAGDELPTSASSSSKGDTKGSSAKDEKKGGSKKADAKKGPVTPKPESGVAADGKLSKKQQREAEAERQALAVPEQTSSSSSKAARPELSTLTTSGGGGMADSKHTTVSAGSHADKHEPKDELETLGATTPDDLVEDGQVGAESTDLTQKASQAASQKAAAASKTLENDLEGVYSRSGKFGKKGSGVIKSILGMFSGGDPSESDYQRSRTPAVSSQALMPRGDATAHSRRGEDSEAWR